MELAPCKSRLPHVTGASAIGQCQAIDAADLHRRLQFNFAACYPIRSPAAAVKRLGWSRSQSMKFATTIAGRCVAAAGSKEEQKSGSNTVIRHPAGK